MMHLKSTILTFLSLLIFIGNYFSQALNQPANWPNTNWTKGGMFVPSSILQDPTVSDMNFAYSDDNSGTGVTDNIWVSSPTIDLTAAHSVGGYNLVVNTTQIFQSFDASDRIYFEYWDADNSGWVNFHTIIPIPNNFVDDYSTCSGNTALTTDVLDIENFTPTQLSGFKYRINYDDFGGWNYGFCISSPTLVITADCPIPTMLSATNIAEDGADLGWTENGSATLWDIEVVTSGTTPTGTPTTANSPNNPTTVTGLNLSLIHI